MTEQKVILERLLEKYENSKHLLSPGTSSRRVFINSDKGTFPEYTYQDSDIRDKYNAAASELERLKLVKLKWKKGLPVIEEVSLNLENVEKSYSYLGKTHPWALAKEVEDLVSKSLARVKVPWICNWKEDVIKNARERLKLPSCCKNGDLSRLKYLLQAFYEYSLLGDSGATMRAFSSKCYDDTKRFEQEVEPDFLRAARKYNSELAQALEEQEDKMGEREQLNFLGLYVRPEFYLLSGKCYICTSSGALDLGTAYPNGIGVPSTLVNLMTGVNMPGIKRIVFIENRTNYDEYLLSELNEEELVVYQGGFMGPMKKKFFSKLTANVERDTEVLFWADIDLGGFQMFSQLETIVPTLKPMRMSGEYVEKFHVHGLKRDSKYLENLKTALRGGRFLKFNDAIEKILEYGVTIEQETFLNERCK